MSADTIGDAPLAFERDKNNQAWARWLARSLDRLMVLPLAFFVFFAIGAAVEFGRLPAEFIAWVDDPLMAVIGELAVVFALSALWEPLFLANTGTTPGKFIMGVRVKAADGRNIGLVTAYKRFFWVYVLGLGLGIPILSLVCMLIARAKLQSEGATAWDQGLDISVLHVKRHPIVWACGLVAVIGVNIAIGVLSRMPG